MPAAGATKKYLYQIMRYWTGEDRQHAILVERF
jgi:hypothetical protein